MNEKNECSGCYKNLPLSKGLYIFFFLDGPEKGEVLISEEYLPRLNYIKGQPVTCKPSSDIAGEGVYYAVMSFLSGVVLYSEHEDLYFNN